MHSCQQHNRALISESIDLLGMVSELLAWFTELLAVKLGPNSCCSVQALPK